jgi:hypothetical protein
MERKCAATLAASRKDGTPADAGHPCAEERPLVRAIEGHQPRRFLVRRATRAIFASRDFGIANGGFIWRVEYGATGLPSSVEWGVRRRSHCALGVSLDAV